jgi:hypothetical protein
MAGGPDKIGKFAVSSEVRFPMKRRSVVSATVLLCLALSLRDTAWASTEVGSCLPTFELVNLQPKSPTYEQGVSSYAYTDRATVFMLLSAG